MTRTILSIAPGALGADTFSRAGSATYFDSNGVLQAAAAGVVRDAHYEQGARTILLEGAGTNLWKATEDLTNAAWAKGPNVTISANATAAPSAAVTADKMVPGAAVDDNDVYQLQDLTSGQPYRWTYFAKAGGYSWLRAQVELTAGTVRVFFDVANGVVGQTTAGASTGLSATMTALANGWYRCEVAFTPTVTQAAVPCTVRMQQSNGQTDAFAGDGTSGVYLWGADFRATATRFSYFPNASGSASATSSPDLIGWTIPDAPHAMEWTIEFFEHGQVATASVDVGIASLGNDAHSGAFLDLRVSSTHRYDFVHRNGTGLVESPIPFGNTPSIGDRVKLRGVLYSDGSVELFQSVNGGAEITGGRTFPLAFSPDGWSGQTVRLNSLGTGSQGDAAYVSATLTDLHVPQPSVSFTDAQGPVTIPLQVRAFEQWVPMTNSVADRETALGTGQTFEYQYRVDYGASFRLPYLKPSQLDLCARLKLWLLSGGQVTVFTDDTGYRSYTCTLWPGADVPDPELTDRQFLWYTQALQVRNVAAAPMLCVYQGAS